MGNVRTLRRAKHPAKAAVPFRAGRTPDPSGVYCLTPDNLAGNTQISNLPTWPWTDSRLAGIATRAQWSSVEPASGSYDWSYFDTAVGLAASHGKMVSLAIVTNNSPQWLFNFGAKRFAGTSPYPNPWDPVFIQYWKRMIHAFARRYDGNPSVSYITVGGPGYTEECYLSHTSAYGYDTNSWVVATGQILRLYVNAFTETPIFLAMAQPVPGASQDMINVAEYAKAIGIGLKENALSSNTPASSTWQYSELVSVARPNCLQFVSAQRENTITAVQYGMDLKGRCIEVYAADVPYLAK
jgi:Beta-galactosidase